MKTTPATKKAGVWGVRKKKICKYSSIMSCKTLGINLETKFKSTSFETFQFKYSDPSICLSVASPPSANSDHALLC